MLDKFDCGTQSQIPITQTSVMMIMIIIIKMIIIVMIIMITIIPVRHLELTYPVLPRLIFQEPGT